MYRGRTRLDVVVTNHHNKQHKKAFNKQFSSCKQQTYLSPYIYGTELHKYHALSTFGSKNDQKGTFDDEKIWEIRYKTQKRDDPIQVNKYIYFCPNLNT